MILWLPAPYLNWLYKVDAVRYRGRFVFTNTVPKGSHHGGIFGRLSSGWMQHMNRVAEELGMDPLDFRLKNVVVDGDASPLGKRWKTPVAKRLLETAEQESGYRAPRRVVPGKRVGIGFSLCERGTGAGPCTVKVVIDTVVTNLATGSTGLGELVKALRTTESMDDDDVLNS